MDFDNEKNYEEKPATEQQNTGSRDGYQQTGNGFQRDYRGRSPRPRIHTAQRPAYNNERSGYNRRDNDEGGFRPEGFGAGLQSSVPRQQGYRPRTSYNNGGGYQPRGGYQSRPYGNKPYKPYNAPYNPNKSYGQDADQQGYQPRQQGGGYQSRQSQGEYGQQSRGGYQPRGGYRPAYGGQNQAPYGSPYNNRYKKSYNKRPRTADYDPNAKYSLKKRIEYKEINYDPNEPVRLNKFLANAGVCSRREADEFIQAGVVTVNGQVVTELGTKILRTDEVKFHDQPVIIEKKVYVLLNKPKDYVTTSDDPQQRKTVMDLVKDACPERIYPVGRLDRNTTGVLLLTNDGDLASKLTHPKYLKKKIYHVYLDKNVTAHDIQQIAEGIQLEDGEIKADDVQYADPIDKKQVGIEIHSGKNRIVRRIFESLGYKVLKLDRVQFAGLTKKNVRRGDWRYLTEEEVDRLRMGAYE
ncbi:MAG: RNA-binding S4 domain-containing protein [Prevotella sp.]|nr:RNA-binding S4 domain-containing protein [Prevotella sp.]